MEELQLLEKLPHEVKGGYRLQIRKYNPGLARWYVAYFDLDCNLLMDFFKPTLLEALIEMDDWLEIEGYYK